MTLPTVEFARQGRRVDLVENPPVVTSRLAPGYYTVDYDPRSEDLYLSEVEAFALPPKIYGDSILDRVERIKKTAADRPGTTGVMLFGEKGSGKTLLGRKVAVDLVAQGQPCIILNKPYNGDMLGSFLQRIGQPVTLFLDEFEKVFDTKQQEGLLTVLDGTYPLKLLAIMTLNSSDRVIGPLQNRPGRAFYSIAYHGLTPDFVRAFGEDHLSDPEQLEELVRLATISTLNFDQLNAIIEEMNRFDEGVRDAIQLLNVDVSTGGDTYPMEGVHFHESGVTCTPKDIVEYSLWFELMDQGEEDNHTLTVLLPNEQKLTNKQAAEVTAISEGYYNSRIWDTRVDRDSYAHKSDAVNGTHPHRFTVQGVATINVNQRGLIELFFERSTMGPVTITLRKPQGYSAKNY